jgi:hypothetical protein
MSDRAVIGLLCGSAAFVAIVIILALPAFLAPPPPLTQGATSRALPADSMPRFRMPASTLKEPRSFPARPFRPTPTSATAADDDPGNWDGADSSRRNAARSAVWG